MAHCFSDELGSSQTSRAGTDYVPRIPAVIYLLLMIGWVVLSCAPQMESEQAQAQRVETVAVAGADSDTTAPEIDVYSLLRPWRISPYDRIVKKYARRYGFDWRLISAQIYAESRFRPGIVSKRGAVGLMQILPSTARHFNVDPKLLLNPEQNIALGCYYDRWLYEKWDEARGFHRLALTMASYNAGRSRVLRALALAGHIPRWDAVVRYVPGQTRHYVRKIFAKYEEYKRRVL